MKSIIMRNAFSIDNKYLFDNFKNIFTLRDFSVTINSCFLSIDNFYAKLLNIYTKSFI